MEVVEVEEISREIEAVPTAKQLQLRQTQYRPKRGEHGLDLGADGVLVFNSCPL